MRDDVATALRDGVLQDLLAVSMLIAAARTRLPGANAAPMRELLENAEATLQTDLDQLRAMIETLNNEVIPA